MDCLSNSILAYLNLYKFCFDFSFRLSFVRTIRMNQFDRSLDGRFMPLYGFRHRCFLSFGRIFCFSPFLSRRFSAIDEKIQTNLNFFFRHIFKFVRPLMVRQVLSMYFSSHRLWHERRFCAHCTWTLLEWMIKTINWSFVWHAYADDSIDCVYVIDRISTVAGNQTTNFLVSFFTFLQFLSSLFALPCFCLTHNSFQLSLSRLV